MEQSPKSPRRSHDGFPVPTADAGVGGGGRRFPRRLHARSKIFLLLLVAILPLAILRAHDLETARRQQIDGAKARALELAREGAEMHDELVGRAGALLDLLAQVPSIQSVEKDSCHDLLRQVVAHNPWSTVVAIFGVDGVPICGSAAGKPSAINLSDRPYFQQALKSSQPVVSDLVIARGSVPKLGGKPTFMVAKSVSRNAGDISAVLLVAVDMGWVRRIVERVGEKTGGSVMLLDRQGVLLASAPGRGGVVGESVAHEPGIAEVLAGTEGTFETSGRRGAGRIIGHASIPAAGARIVVEFSTSDIVAAASRQFARHMWELLATIAVAALLAWAAAEFLLLRWIERLRSAAERLGSGDFGARTMLPDAAGEFALVGRALDDASVKLGEREAMLREAERLLRESEARYRMLVDNATDMVIQLDREFVRRYVSPASREVLGYEPEELLGRKPIEIIHPDDAAEVSQVYRQAVAGLDRSDVVYRIRHKDGHWVWVEAELRALREPATNEIVGIIGAVRDISDRKRVEAVLAASEARFRMLAESTADLVTHISADGKRLFASPASRDLLGYEPEELIGGHPRDLAHPEDWPSLASMLAALAEGGPAASVQFRALRKDGTYLWVEATARLLDAGQGVVLSTRNIDRRKFAEDELDKAIRQLKALASLDGLTGLANRRSFDEALEREVARAARAGTSMSLLLADVDHFKDYNDTYGHPAGDDCLREMSRLLQETIRRPGDLTARYGGEEFAAILPNTGAEGAAALAESLRRRVEAAAMPHEGSGFGVVTISVGIATVEPRDGNLEAAALLQQADKALYCAKIAGRNLTRAYSVVPARRAG